MVENSGQEIFFKWDKCHKSFTRPYMILLVLHQIATEYF